MNRFRIGVGFLAVLLGLSLWVQKIMQNTQEPIAAALAAAEENARSGHWDAAKQYADAAAGRWQESWHLTAAFADHGPMEDIDALMAQLPAFLRQRDEAQFTALCAELIRRVNAMVDAHRLKWWNLM